MSDTPEKPANSPKKRAYKKPELERMNDKGKAPDAAGSPPAAVAAAHASPIAPGMVVF